MRRILPYAIAMLSGITPPLCPAAPAQEVVPQTGLHYFAFENLDAGRVDLRGTAGSNGVAHAGGIALAPNTRYRHTILQAATLLIGSTEFETPASGRRFALPPIVVGPSSASDSDGDGLPDDGELVMGTNPQNPDSDGDGARDGPEVQLGDDPLDGLPARTGIIATADTPGTSVDVCAVDDMAVVADSAAGVSVFNVFNGMSPLIVAQVDTPGTAQAVACAGRLIAVADGPQGLAIIDMADPPAARIVHQVSVGSASAVAAADGTAYVGVGSTVVAVDLASGAFLGGIDAGAAVHDLGVSGDALFVLTASRLRAYALLPFFPDTLGSAPTSNFGAEGITDKKRLFAGREIAYATSFPGYDTFDIGDPAAIVRVGAAQDVGPNSFKQDAAQRSLPEHDRCDAAGGGRGPRPDGRRSAPTERHGGTAARSRYDRRRVRSCGGTKGTKEKQQWEKQQ
jgi:hypothetical protein